MKISAFVTLFLLITNIYAGGDLKAGKITSFQTKGNVTIFDFKQTEKNDPLLMGCSSFKVIHAYRHVPWYAVIPFIDVKTSHPTVAQTKKALFYIKKAYKEKTLIRFGYMGSGLELTNKPCVFKSRGLLGDSYRILSFYNPV